MGDQPVGATQDAYGHTSTANQDAALQSLSVAQRALGAGELEKALKFARKSVSLYDTLVGRQLLAKLEKRAFNVMEVKPPSGNERVKTTQVTCQARRVS